MTLATFNFPQGFLWGTATSSYQNEGNNNNSNWSLWENQAGRIANNQKSGLACNWWGGKWKEDFNRAEETFQNSHRLSIEWSRVQPDPDHWDENAIDHYRLMLQDLHQRGIRPMVTLHHFSDPIWLTEIEGWENPDVIELFGKFVNKMVESLIEYCNLWITINEPNVYAVEGYVEGVFPPGKSDLRSAYSVMLNMVKAHARAYEIIHKLQPSAQVGVAINYRHFMPENPLNQLDQTVSAILHNNFNNTFNNAIATGKFNFAFKKSTIRRAAKSQDFIGVNYYTTEKIQFNLLRYKKLFYEAKVPVGYELSENRFITNYPRGMNRAISWARKFQKPIYITENGIEDSSDSLRPSYLIQHLYELWGTTNYIIPIKGYFYWTLVDNFEWERGWTQRFGLWSLDTETQLRKRRRSADLYAEICHSNSLSTETISKYAPEVYKRLFPALN